MFAIFWRTLRDNKWVILTYLLSGVLFLWMYVAFYPSVAKSSAQVSEFVKSLPEGLNKAFGLDPKSFTTFEGFVAGKHYSLVWPILVIALSVSLASSFVAGEIEKGTIEVPFSQPISRIKVILAKFLAGFVAITAFSATSILVTFPLAKLYNISIMSANHLKLTLVGTIFGLAIFAVTMLFSAVFSERGKVVGAALTVFLLMYVLNIVALLKDNLDKLKYFSFFYYFDYSEILLNGKANTGTWWVFLGTFLVAGLTGLLWFNRRDITIV